MIPIRDAIFLAIGSYSSGTSSRSVGNITRSLGAAPSCFLVLYTTNAHSKPFTRFNTSSVLPAGMLSISRVIRHLLFTLPLFLREPLSRPPTNPPTSFRSSCCAFVSRLYSSCVSSDSTGVRRRSTNSCHMIRCGFQFVSFLLPPIVMLNSLLCFILSVYLRRIFH